MVILESWGGGYNGQTKVVIKKRRIRVEQGILRYRDKICNFCKVENQFISRSVQLLFTYGSCEMTAL